MIPGLGPIKVIVTYMGGAFVGALALEKAAKFGAKSFLTSIFRGGRKTRYSSSRGR